MSIYLDFNATAPIEQTIIHKIPEWLEDYGNPSSVHAQGRRAKVALETARETIAEVLGVSSERVLFTSGGTEANNWAMIQALNGHSMSNPAHIIVSEIEHACVLNAAIYLESQGVRVTRVKPDPNGVMSVSDIEAAIRPDTRLISVMAANNEVGTIQPITQIASLAQSKGILFHSDTVQILGKSPIDFAQKGLSFATISGHKLGALKGVGALVAHSSETLLPWTWGGGHERAKRSGTENVIGILSLAQAMLELSRRLEAYQSQNWHHFQQRLSRECPGVWMSGLNGAVLPNTCCIAFPGISGRALMMNLDLRGISVSTGSACATGSIEPSHVLQAMGVPAWVVEGAIRISTGPTTTEKDLMDTADVILSYVQTHNKPINTL